MELCLILLWAMGCYWLETFSFLSSTQGTPLHSGSSMFKHTSSYFQCSFQHLSLGLPSYFHAFSAHCLQPAFSQSVGNFLFYVCMIQQMLYLMQNLIFFWIKSTCSNNLICYIARSNDIFDSFFKIKLYRKIKEMCLL